MARFAKACLGEPVWCLEGCDAEMNSRAIGMVLKVRIAAGRLGKDGSFGSNSILTSA